MKSTLQRLLTAAAAANVYCCVVCRDELEVLDADSHHLVLRPSSLPTSIMLNADDARPTPVDTDLPVVIIFNHTMSMKVRFTQASMWASNVARVTVELRQQDDTSYQPALRVRHGNTAF